MMLDFAPGTRISEALGWSLVHSLWEGTIIAAVLAALLISVRSPRIRYVAGCLALLAILASFVITLIHFLPERGSVGTPIKTPLPPWTQVPDGTVSNNRFPGLGLLIPWVGPLWVVGVCTFYLRYAVGWLSSHGWRRRGVCQAPGSWQEFVTRLAIKLRVSRPVLLVESLLADTPVVLGHFRPVVLVPLGFLAGLSPDHVEAILLHELAHIRRSDYLMNVGQRLVEGLLFYHPAMWWISRVIRTERENCCDDIVVSFARRRTPLCGGTYRARTESTGTTTAHARTSRGRDGRKSHASRQAFTLSERPQRNLGACGCRCRFDGECRSGDGRLAGESHLQSGLGAIG